MDIVIKPERLMPITMCASNNPTLLDLKFAKSYKQDTDIELLKST